MQEVFILCDCLHIRAGLLFTIKRCCKSFIILFFIKRQVRQLDSDYFEGTGYGKINIPKAGSLFLVDITLYSRIENGLLFFIGNEVISHLFIVHYDLLSDL